MNLDFLDRSRILVVGDVMLDRYILGEARRISPEAPVPVVEVRGETHTAGGAANVALNLSALGVRCELFGIAGDDNNGRELQGILAGHGVEFDPALCRSGCPTITKARVLAHRQQICRLDWECKPASYTLGEREMQLLEEKARSCQAVILADYAKGVITQTLVDRLRDVCREAGIFLALDPKPKRPLNVAHLDLITPNRGEALLMAGLSPDTPSDVDVEVVARTLLDRHAPRFLVVTLSEEGMLLATQAGGIVRFPTAAREVADVSGAGDTVIAVLTAGLAGGLAPAEAVRAANAAAGVVVSKLGTATLNRAELAAALKT